MAVTGAQFRGQDINPARSFAQGFDWAERNRRNREEDKRQTELFEFKKRQQDLLERSLVIKEKQAEFEWDQLQDSANQQENAIDQMIASQNKFKQNGGIIADDPVKSKQNTETHLQELTAILAQNPSAAKTIQPYLTQMQAQQQATNMSAQMRSIQNFEAAANEGKHVFRATGDSPGAARQSVNKFLSEQSPYLRVETIDFGNEDAGVIVHNELSDAGRAYTTARLSQALSSDKPAEALNELVKDVDFAPILRTQEGAELFAEATGRGTTVRRARIGAEGQIKLEQIRAANKQREQEAEERTGLTQEQVEQTLRDNPNLKIASMEANVQPNGQVLMDVRFSTKDLTERIADEETAADQPTSSLAIDQVLQAQRGR